MKEELTKCSKEYLIKQLEYSYKEIERLKNLLQKKWEETSKYVEIADDYEKRLNKAIDNLEESQKGLEEWHFDGYDPCLEEIIKILKGEDNDKTSKN